MSGHTSIAAVALALALAGCGGTSGSTNSGSSGSSSTAVAGKTTATANASASTTRTSSAGGRTNTTSSTSTSTPTTPTTTTTTNAAPSLPARFVIETGGRLNPPLVAAPGHTDIQLTVRSGDGQAHRFVLDTPRPHVLKPSAGSAVGLRLVGVPNGTYPIDVDGVRRGKLIVGATPGP